MSLSILRVTEQRARKDYPCDACDYFVIAEVEPLDLTEEQKEAVKEAEADGWRIKKGQVYRKVISKYDGRMGVFRARPAMDALCHALDLYPDE